MVEEIENIIKELEKAKVGSRRLDALIYVSLGKDGWTLKAWSDFLNTVNSDAESTCPLKTPHYTTSVDAAMSLIPEEFRLDQIGEWEAPTLRAMGPWYAILVLKNTGVSLSLKTRADHKATAALALSLAAYRAHHANITV